MTCAEVETKPKKPKVVKPAPTHLPNDGMSRFAQFKPFIPFSREKWRQLVRDLKAPQPIRMGTRCTMWRNSELHEFLDNPVNYKDLAGK